MFERIRGFFMNVLSYFNRVKIDDIVGIDTKISSDMYNKIVLWNDLMKGQAPWNAEAKPCGILPQIAGRLNYFVSREIGLEIKNEVIEKPLTHLNKNVDKIVEYIALVGSGLLRPIYANEKLQYEIIPLGNYLPTKYDFDGSIMGAIILKQITEKNRDFVLCEVHDFDGRNHIVTSRLYENKNGGLMEVSLGACSMTAEITPQYTWADCKRPMIVEFRNHATNKIDGSNVPVALIDDAIDIIEKADKQFERMDWEQEAGAKKIFADRDMFAKRTSRNGAENETKLTPTLKKLIQTVDGDGSQNGEKIHEWSPELRTTAQNDYLQQVFRRIELTLNVGKGTVSDAESVQQTATQYNGGRQELFAIVDKIEDEIEQKYKDAAEVFSYMASAYAMQGAPRGVASADDLLVIKWNDDQTRKDIQQAKQTAMQEISAGVKNKWEYRRDFYGEDEATAKANVPPEPIASSPFGLM